MRYKGVFTFLNAVVTGQVGGVILYNSYNFGTQYSWFINNFVQDKF